MKDKFKSVLLTSSLSVLFALSTNAFADDSPEGEAVVTTETTSAAAPNTTSTGSASVPANTEVTSQTSPVKEDGDEDGKPESSSSTVSDSSDGSGGAASGSDGSGSNGEKEPKVTVVSVDPEKPEVQAQQGGKEEKQEDKSDKGTEETSTTPSQADAVAKLRTASAANEVYSKLANLDSSLLNLQLAELNLLELLNQNTQSDNLLTKFRDLQKAGLFVDVSYNQLKSTYAKLKAPFITLGYTFYHPDKGFNFGGYVSAQKTKNEFDYGLQRNGTTTQVGLFAGYNKDSAHVNVLANTNLNNDNLKFNATIPEEYKDYTLTTVDNYNKSSSLLALQAAYDYDLSTDFVVTPFLYTSYATYNTSAFNFALVKSEKAITLYESNLGSTSVTEISVGADFKANLTDDVSLKGRLGVGNVAFDGGNNYTFTNAVKTGTVDSSKLYSFKYIAKLGLDVKLDQSQTFALEGNFANYSKFKVKELVGRVSYTYKF